ncbi:TRAP transporter large permease [Mesorhizobium sp.]|uniref:TRAP transporter large permease n=1 Tax=Mesorhizobium sp. TaxID=1871066 RepID=UPI0025EDAFB9|nr:TRAP transporter large permease [Mesorhizobium sp.]
MTVLFLATFFILLLLGTPIAFVLALTGLVGIYLSPGGSQILPVVPQEIFRSLNSFPLLTIPLFILAGSIMSETGIAKRLMDLAEGTVGRGKGGLGAATVASTMFFHGISGSSTADTAAIARVVLPSLKTQGYPVPFSTALLAAAGATATLVPPTIDLIIIGVIANISIAGLFAAGIIPAIINGLALIGMVIYLSRRSGYGIVVPPRSLREHLMSFVRAVPALFMILIILGGILGGAFTPTEASVVAVLYGLFISTFVYREFRIAHITPILRSTVLLTGVVMLVIAGSAVLSYALMINQLPQQLAETLRELTSDPLVFLLLVQVIFFFAGMMMDGLPALLVAMPILMPIARDLGIDPIHFGILVEANVALHLAMPPVGMCLNVACAVSRLPVERVIRPLLPFIGILVVTTLVITYVECFSVFLPRFLGLDK